VSIAATDPDAAEEASDPGTFTLSRTGDTTDALVVSFTIATGAGEATNGIDYVEESSGTDLATSVTIPAGSASIAITIVPVDDTEAEGPETVVLTIAPDAAYVVGAAGSAVVTIADNEVPPEVSIAATDAAAAEAGADVGTFTVSRTGETAADLVVHFTGVAGTAANDVDYQVSGGALATNVTIPAGSASITITIVPVDDADAEGPETVVLTIAPDAAYVVGAAGSAVVTIADDDVPPEVSVAATDAAAAEEGADTGTFDFTRVGGASGDLVVHFTIATGPAQAVNGLDYVEQSSGTDLATSVTIPDGSASATVTIVPVDDGNEHESATPVAIWPLELYGCGDVNPHLWP
jgi:hypothetical protein